MMMLAWIPYYAFGVFFTPMLTEFGWTRAITSGAFSGSQIVRGLAGIVMGRLNDKVGPRIVLTSCAIFLGIGFLLMFFIHSLWQFYLVFTILIGIGSSGFWVPLISTVAKWFVKRRSTMSGIVMMSTGVATLVGAPVANLLLHIFDWRFSYVLMGISILLIIPFSAQFLKRDPSEIGQSPDGEIRDLQKQKVAPAGVPFAGAVKSNQFWLFFTATTCLGYCIFSVTVHIVPYAICLNISPVEAANILATFGAVSLIGRIVLGNAADRIGDRLLYRVGFIITTLSFFLLTISTQTWMLYLFAALFGLIQAGMGTVGSPLLAELFGLRSHGLIFGVANFGFAMGAALGPFISGYVFDLTGSYQRAFAVCSAVGFIGIIMSLLLRKPAVKLG
jgi:MFS family permease